jgi:thymidylate synthase
MRPKINYHYTIGYKPQCCYKFDKKNDIVDETCYYNRVVPKLPLIIFNLKNNPDSRQEVIMTHNNLNYACLLSLQFQIRRTKLIVIANFRSQCKVNGRPNDEKMLRYFATKVLKGLDLKRFKIYVNVGNYHINNSKK